MNKKALVVLAIIVIAVISGGYLFYTSRVSSLAGLKVASTPSASVFLNDSLVGKTPYEGKHPSGEYILKLIPESTVATAYTWQGKIILNPSLLTYVKRDLGSSELTSSGEILSLEKTEGSQAQIAVFSSPDGAVVILDGQEKGATPLLLSDIIPGEYEVAVSSPGFAGRTVKVQATAGYKLSINFQLALLENTDELSSDFSTPSSEIKKEKEFSVLIKETPTGFLRVRSEPTTASSEIGRVKPEEKYPFLEEKKGWYKISYEEDKEGWVSGRYAEKIETR